MQDTAEKVLAAGSFAALYSFSWVGKQFYTLGRELGQFLLIQLILLLPLLALVTSPIWFTGLLYWRKGMELDLFESIGFFLVLIPSIALTVAVVLVPYALYVVYTELAWGINLAVGCVAALFYLPARFLAMVAVGAVNGFRLGFNAAMQGFQADFVDISEAGAVIDGFRFNFLSTGFLSTPSFSPMAQLKYQWHKLKHVFVTQTDISSAYEPAPFAATAVGYIRDWHDFAKTFNEEKDIAFFNWLQRKFLLADNSSLDKSWSDIERSLSKGSSKAFLAANKQRRNYDAAHSEENIAMAELAQLRLQKEDCLPRLRKLPAKQLAELVEELRGFGLSKAFDRANSEQENLFERAMVQYGIDRLLRFNEQDPATGLTSREILLGYWWLIKQQGYKADQLRIFRQGIIDYVHGGWQGQHDVITVSCKARGVFANSADLQGDDAPMPDPGCHARVRNLCGGIALLPDPSEAGLPSLPQLHEALAAMQSETLGPQQQTEPFINEMQAVVRYLRPFMNGLATCQTESFTFLVSALQKLTAGLVLLAAEQDCVANIIKQQQLYHDESKEVTHTLVEKLHLLQFAKESVIDAEDEESLQPQAKQLLAEKALYQEIKLMARILCGRSACADKRQDLAGDQEPARDPERNYAFPMRMWQKFQQSEKGQGDKPAVSANGVPPAACMRTVF